MIVHLLIANEGKAPSARQGKACRELVKQAENLVATNSDEPVHIMALCHALLSARGRFARHFTGFTATHLAVTFECCGCLTQSMPFSLPIAGS
jgi:hypothetical protein